MIAKQLAGVTASIDITINDAAVNYNSIVNLTVEATEDLHDYLLIEMSGIPPRAIVDYYGSPVRLVISSGAQYVHEFYGTVEHVQPVAATGDGLLNGSPFQHAKLHCYGASYRMRSQRSRVWDLTTLPQMAEELADTYGFSLDVPKTPLIFRRFVQHGESDWKALARFVGMHGMRINVHGTHMHIYDPAKALSRDRSYHKVRTLSGYGPSNVPGKLIDLKGHFGRSSRDGSLYDTIVPVVQDDGTYYDMRASEITGRTGGTLDDRQLEAVDTYAEAKAIITSEVNNYYDFHAYVQCLGLAGCVPGGVVELDKMRGGFDGNWYVKSVKHIVNTSAFLTELEVCRHSDRELGATSTTPYASPPASVLLGSRWEARRKVVREYA